LKSVLVVAIVFDCTCVGSYAVCYVVYVVLSLLQFRLSSWIFRWL